MQANFDRHKQRLRASSVQLPGKIRNTVQLTRATSTTKMHQMKGHLVGYMGQSQKKD